MYPQQQFGYGQFGGFSPMMSPSLFGGFNPYNDLFAGFQTKLDDLFKNYQTQLNANTAQQQSVISENAAAIPAKKQAKPADKQVSGSGIAKAAPIQPNVQYGGSRRKPAQGMYPSVIPQQPNAQIGSLFGSTGTGVAKNPNSPMMTPRFR